MTVDQKDNIFVTERSFADLGLGPEIVRALEKEKFQHPTRVQADLIPAILSGRDILGQSKTGTGKTLAFGLPLLQKVEPKLPIQALIIVPTRELAVQVTEELRWVGEFTQARVTAVYGGQPIRKQVIALSKNPPIVVGTPGRLQDLHERGELPFDNIRFVVLDEVDRMLDIGFREDIRRILGQMRHPHQTVMVSATISQEIEKLAKQYQRDPLRIDASASPSLTVSQVRQHYFFVQPWDKKQLLVHLLTHEEPALTLVFCRTKHTVDALSQYLQRKGIDAQAIHGDMYQGKRNKVMEQLRSGVLKVLVCSDLAARGLDVEGITHVINFDLPEDPEIYVHRIGRTARLGRTGEAWSFVAPEQGSLLSAIEQLTNVEVMKIEYPDFRPSTPPPEVMERERLAAQRAEDLRVQRSRAQLAPPRKEDAVDKDRFPGGIVPSSLPAKRLGGRIRSRRG
jgi:ATP-dependent RNA helicase DeaD